LIGESSTKANSQLRSTLLAFFKHWTARSCDVEDLVQDVFVRLARRDDTDQIVNRKGYAFRIAQNRLKDYYLRKGPAAHKRTVNLPNLLAEAAVAHQVVDWIEPERVLLAKSELGGVMEALGHLEERTLQIFLLHRVERQKRQDIARHVGISVRAVDKHLAKAVACVSRYLDSRHD
jgi:RNA polymerase sigma-70 factor (ECF subfamily)